MESGQVIVVGDVHMDFGPFNTLLQRKRPSIVLQCGDFGFWPRMTQKELYGRSSPNYPKTLPVPKVPTKTKVYWCDGNHEDFQELRFRKTNELWPRVYYMPRGTVLTLPDGRNVMFFGGAKSIDSNIRTLGLDWFTEEEISYADIRNLKYDGRVDIMVTHTCPNEFDIVKDGSKDGSRDALSHLLERFRPALWYFGHWHDYMTGYINGCRWVALDMVHGKRWWEVLPT